MTQATVKLKNGAEEVASLVATVMLKIHRLFEEGHGIAFFELVSLARDRQHKPFGDTGKTLADLQLIQPIGDGLYSMDESIRNIVFSGAAGEGLNLTWGDPIYREA